MDGETEPIEITLTVIKVFCKNMLMQLTYFKNSL